MTNVTRYKNARISNVSISMEDHDILTFHLMLEGNGWGCNLGGYMLGKGYLGAKEFKGNKLGIECLMRIMDVVGVSKWEDLKGKYIRVVDRGWSSVINEIGNIIEDKWLNFEDFFNQDEPEARGDED